MDPLLVTTTVTIILAFTGYLATYLNSVRLAQRNQRLERIHKQLGEFYGPMYGLIGAESAVFGIFRSIYRTDKHFFSEHDPPTKEDLEAWRLWMTTVFAPINNRMYELVLSKSDLLIETEMPPCLQELCAHVVGYQMVMKKWEQGDYSEHMSLLPFPQEKLEKYVEDSYNALKSEQATLLGKNPKSENSQSPAPQ
jgi:hypothetical protein